VNPLRGIAFKVVSVLLFVVMAACIKASADTVPPGERVFFRSFFAMLVIIGWLAWTGTLRHGLETLYPMGHLWRGLVGTAAMGFVFTALGLLPLPEATALGYAAPLLVVIFAAMFLNEQVRAFRLSAVAVGLGGVMIVLWPRLTVELTGPSAPEALGALAALLGAVFTALAQVFVRKLISTDGTPSIVFYFSLTATLLSLVTLPFGWSIPPAREAMLLVGAGLLGGLGQIMLTEGYRHAEAGTIAPFEYVSMLFALGLGYLLFGETPSRTMLAGALLIVASGLYILWRERKLGLQRARARKVMTPQG
jgi:drug/metabolite transporter (DMT)-like permease